MVSVGCTPWPMPVIPALWEAKVRSLRPAWPRWRNPCLLKTQKLGGHDGGQL